MDIDIPALIVLTAGAYLFGAIPFGLLLAKYFHKTDLRLVGSGNIGATNARRVGGWKLGLATLVLDAAKGAIPTGIALVLLGKDGHGAHAAVCMVAFASFAGHLYPVYLGFSTGGKGVSTAAGCFMVLSPWALASAIAVFIVVAALGRRVSAASLAAAAALPAAVFLAENAVILTAGAAVFSVAVIWSHRENIARLLNGTEARL